MNNIAMCVFLLKIWRFYRKLLSLPRLSNALNF